MYEIRKISYAKGNQTEINRWLDRVIEDVIIELLKTTDEEEMNLRISKYTE